MGNATPARMNKITVFVTVVLTFFASDFGRHVAKAQNDTTLEVVEDFCDNCTITYSEHFKKQFNYKGNIIFF